MMKKIINIVSVMMVVICFSKGNKVTAQDKDPKTVMAGIYTAYDSASYLTFDVKYMYTSDTLNGNFINESLQGSYTMAGKKALYRLGNIQYMQNDSFLIAVYNDEKFILVADPQTKNVGSNLPLRSLMDSILHSYSAHYIISTQKINRTISALNFVRKDSLAQFDKFSITYFTKGPALLASISYDFKEATYSDKPDSAATQLGNPAPIPIVYRHRTLAVDFSNYRSDNSSKDLYDENNYIRLENGKWVPADKYKDFRIYYSRTGGVAIQPQTK
jgi:hypothetical protein